MSERAARSLSPRRARAGRKQRVDLGRRRTHRDGLFVGRLQLDVDAEKRREVGDDGALGVGLDSANVDGDGRRARGATRQDVDDVQAKRNRAAGDDVPVGWTRSGQLRIVCYDGVVVRRSLPLFVVALGATSCFAFTDFSSLTGGGGGGLSDSGVDTITEAGVYGSDGGVVDDRGSDGGADGGDGGGDAGDTPPPANLLGNVENAGCALWQAFDGTLSPASVAHTNNVSCRVCVEANGAAALYTTTTRPTSPGQIYDGELWVRLDQLSPNPTRRVGLAIINEFSNGGNEPIATNFTSNISDAYSLLTASYLLQKPGVGVTLGFYVDGADPGECFFIDDAVVTLRP